MSALPRAIVALYPVAPIDPGPSLCYSLAVAAKVGKIEKELKAPDHFVSFWAKVGKIAGENSRAILIGAGALLGLALITWGVRSYMNTRAEATTQAFSRIQRVISAPVVAEGSKAATPPAQEGVPQFKTEAERAQAGLKEVDGFLSAHGGSSLRDEAQLLRGRLLVSTGKATEAVTLYESLRGSVEPRFAFLVEEGLAYAQEAAGQPDKAIETLTTLAEQSKSAGNFFRDRALFHKARLLEAKGAAKDAEKLYREILAETPTTALKEEINNRLASLESK
jgi:tetratricopeptide (TPR) repeat protein